MRESALAQREMGERALSIGLANLVTTTRGLVQNETRKTTPLQTPSRKPLVLSYFSLEEERDSLQASPPPF